MYNDYVVFTVVRNPYSRAASGCDFIYNFHGVRTLCERTLEVAEPSSVLMQMRCEHLCMVRTLWQMQGTLSPMLSNIMELCDRLEYMFDVLLSGCNARHTGRQCTARLQQGRLCNVCTASLHSRSACMAESVPRDSGSLQKIMATSTLLISTMSQRSISA